MEERRALSCSLSAAAAMAACSRSGEVGARRGSVGSRPSSGLKGGRGELNPIRGDDRDRGIYIFINARAGEEWGAEDWIRERRKVWPRRARPPLPGGGGGGLDPSLLPFLPAAWASLLLGSFLLFPSPYFPFLFEGLAFFRAIDSTRLYTCTAAAAWKGKKPLADFLFGDFCFNRMALCVLHHRA